MQAFQKFFNLRSSTNRADNPLTSQRSSRAMQQQIVEMMRENERFVRRNPIVEEPEVESENESEPDDQSPNKKRSGTENPSDMKQQAQTLRIPRPIAVTEQWLEDARNAVRNGCLLRCSYSSPQLGNIEQESHTEDPIVADLLRNMTSTVLEICRSTKGYVGLVRCEPCRILMTTEGVIVIIKYKNMQRRQERISNYIKSYLESADLLDTKGEPLLSDRVPKRTVAIRWEAPDGTDTFKRVRFLRTFNCFDYFLDYETGEILEIRWDITRFYRLPYSFDSQLTALRSFNTNEVNTNVTWDRHTTNVLNNLIKKATIKPDYVGREFPMDALKPHILNRSQSATRTPKKRQIRRIKSEDSDPMDITCIDKDDGTIDKIEVF